MTQPWSPPPPFQPYPPPPPRRDRDVMAVVVAGILATAVAGVALGGVGVVVYRQEDRAEQRREQAAEQAFDTALDGPADTATVSPAPDGSREMERALVAGLEGGSPPVTTSPPLREATIGDGEPAFALDGEFVDDDGDERRLRVVVFDHVGETFRADLVSEAALWGTNIASMERILASWRWG